MPIRTLLSWTLMRTVMLSLMLAVVALAGCTDGDSGADEGIGAVVPGSASWNAGIVDGPVGPFSVFADGVTVELPGSGEGIWLHNHVLYWTNGSGLTTFDVRDPMNPVQLATINEWTDNEGELRNLAARDVDVLELNGRVYAMLGGSGQGIHAIDVTNPAAPFYASNAPVLHAGAHNIASVEGTPYVYVAGSAGLPADTEGNQNTLYIDVADFTDLADPTMHSFAIPQQINEVATTSNGCHDITVRMDLGRAYCGGAGGQYLTGGGESFVWDISSDPLNPEWMSMVDDPRIVYHHQAFANADGTLMIVNDEYVGTYPYSNIATGPTGQGNPVGGANNCFSGDAPSSEDQYPVAAAWIWDISDERNPVLLSHIQNDQGNEGEDGTPANPTEGNCGSHFGSLVDGQEAFVMGWYDGGSIFVDFSDPENPTMTDQVDPTGGETWESRYWNGYVFHASGDLLVTPLA
jgi:hypothetical protein